MTISEIIRAAVLGTACIVLLIFCVAQFIMMFSAEEQDFEVDEDGTSF